MFHAPNIRNYKYRLGGIYYNQFFTIIRAYWWCGDVVSGNVVRWCVWSVMIILAVCWFSLHCLHQTEISPAEPRRSGESKHWEFLPEIIRQNFSPIIGHPLLSSPPVAGRLVKYVCLGVWLSPPQPRRSWSDNPIYPVSLCQLVSKSRYSWSLSLSPSLSFSLQTDNKNTKGLSGLFNFCNFSPKMCEVRAGPRQSAGEKITGQTNTNSLLATCWL